MIFRKMVRAGTLLYALLMMGIFTLLLQFYIQVQLAAGHAWQAKQEETQAYFMAQMVKEDILMVSQGDRDEKEKEALLSSKEEAASPKSQPPRSGQVSFTAGQATYKKMDQLLQVQVRLDSGQSYQYHFPIPSEN